MRKPSYALVVDASGFNIHELNDMQQDRYLCGPFESSDQALRELQEMTGSVFAVPLVEKRNGW